MTTDQSTAAADLLDGLDEKPAPLPISATDALDRLDKMIAIFGLWERRRGQIAQAMQISRAWLQMIRPHVAEAAERSNDPD